MSPDYLLLCGIMWAQYASEDACRELLRALHSEDPDVVLLACALLERTLPSDGGRSSRDRMRVARDIRYRSWLGLESFDSTFRREEKTH